MYKIKNTELDFESRIFHLHKIFYSAVYFLKLFYLSYSIIDVSITTEPGNRIAAGVALLIGVNF